MRSRPGGLIDRVSRNQNCGGPTVGDARGKKLKAFDRKEEREKTLEGQRGKGQVMFGASRGRRKKGGG